jgi:hypothetical protein
LNQPTKQEINEVLDKLEKPRWQSDAEKQGLPLATTTSGTGATLLKVDEVLRRTLPDYAKRK